MGSILSGIPDHPIEDLKISNVMVQHQGGGTAEMAKMTPPEEIAKYPDPGMFGTMPSQAFFLRHIDRLEMSHVEVTPAAPDARPRRSCCRG